MAKLQIADKPTLDKVYDVVAQNHVDIAQTVVEHVAPTAVGATTQKTIVEIQGKGKLYHALTRLSTNDPDTLTLKITLDGNVIYHWKLIGPTDNSNASGSAVIGIFSLNANNWFVHSASSGGGYTAYLPTTEFTIFRASGRRIQAQLTPELQQHVLVDNDSVTRDDYCTANIFNFLRFNASLKVEVEFFAHTDAASGTSQPTCVVYSLDE